MFDSSYYSVFFNMIRITTFVISSSIHLSFSIYICYICFFIQRSSNLFISICPKFINLCFSIYLISISFSCNCSCIIFHTLCSCNQTYITCFDIFTRNQNISIHFGNNLAICDIRISIKGSQIRSNSITKFATALGYNSNRIVQLTFNFITYVCISIFQSFFSTLT